MVAIGAKLVPMVSIDISYQGDLRCIATHGPSQTQLTTDAPVDNHGKGESFSPTDLLATALGSCMLTVMGIEAQRRGWSLAGVTVEVRKVMTQAPPRKVARLEVAFSVPTATSAELDDVAKRVLEERAHSCPVRLSLAESMEVPVSFGW